MPPQPLRTVGGLIGIASFRTEPSGDVASGVPLAAAGHASSADTAFNPVANCDAGFVENSAAGRAGTAGITDAEGDTSVALDGRTRGGGGCEGMGRTIGKSGGGVPGFMTRGSRLPPDKLNPEASPAPPLLPDCRSESWPGCCTPGYVMSDTRLRNVKYQVTSC